MNDLRAERSSDGGGLRSLLALLRRQAVVVAIPVLVVPAAAFFFSQRQDERYTASASLLLSDQGNQLASQDSEREAATNVRLLELGVIDDRAKRRLRDSAQPPPGLDSVSLKVVGEGESNVITVEATASTAETAALLANAVTTEYVAFRRAAIRGELQEELSRAEREYEAVPSVAQTGARAGQLRDQIRQLKVDAAQVSPDVRQLGRAQPPASPSAPKPLRNTILGLLLGMALGLALAVARERLDVRIKDAKRFETVFGRPIIGKIPESRALGKSPSAELPLVEAQAFRDLRTNLRLTTLNAGMRSLLVTSAEPGDGKTTVAWNLAWTASSPETKVLLIEADLRRPALARRLGTGATPGLTDVLAGDATFEQSLRQLSVASGQNGHGEPRTVDVMLAGTHHSDPAALLESDLMRQLLERAVSDYDLVIIDTAPTSVASDAVPLLPRVEGVIVVGRLSKSRHDMVSELSEQLDALNDRTLGVVVNSVGVPREKSRYYHHVDA